MPAQPDKTPENAPSASAQVARAQRLHALFDSASSLPVSQRAGLLDDERKTDPTLVRDVEALLAHDSSSSTFLDGAVGRLAAALPVRPSDHAPITPDAIPGYTILREIGRGGMGVVHEARQRFPARAVAIKLIRPEFVTHQMLARFHHEADTLGLLEHAGIARLYGAGFIAGDRDRPYMVMELVRGINLRDWPREPRPARDQILEVFLRVCEAVEYAHRKGVVHRDLKPGNILVEPSGQPKILDFGIARLTALDAGVTVATISGQIMGTLAYMSPEQLTGEALAVDSRSDVYALGVILYELLCGKMPVDFTDLNLTQAAVKLQHSEPALLGNLDRTLRGDLEAIAAKALEKDPARRYQAVSELSADIRRHLCGETVLARPQTAWYQGMKYARRHKALVVAGGLLVLSLIAGIVGTSWQAMRASAQGEQARVQASLAEQTSGFLSRILKSPRPEVSRGKDVTVREILDAASKELADDKDLDPRVAAGIWRTLGESYWALSHYPAALASAQRLRDLRLRFAGPDDRDTIWAEGFYGFQLVKTEQREQAIAVLEELLPRARRVLGEADLITIDIRASLARAYLIYTVDPQAVEKALALATENIDITRATFGPDHQRSIQAVSEKWSIHRTFRRKFTPEEIGQITDHWRRAQQLFGHESPPAINALSVCVEALSYNQSISELKAVVTEALPQLRARFGDEHLLIAGLEQQLADVCRREGNLAESARLYDRVYSARRKLEGPDAVRTRVCGFHAVEAHSAARQCARAREILDQRLADARQREASFTPATADHWLEFNIAWCERDLPAMRRLDELLKGSVYEAQTSKHIAILEKELAELAPQPPKD